MQQSNFDFFDKILHTDDIGELENLVCHIYNTLDKNGCTQGQACKIFLSTLRNIRFKEYFLVWLDNKDSEKSEFKFLRLLLELSGLGFHFTQNSLKIDNKKTLMKGLYFESIEIGTDLQKLCFECFNILTSESTIHKFTKLTSIKNSQDFFTGLQRNGSGYTRIILLNAAQRNSISDLLKKIKVGIMEGKVKIPTAFQKIFGSIIKIDGNIHNAEQALIDSKCIEKVSIIFKEELIVRKLLLLIVSGIKEPSERFEKRDDLFKFIDQMIHMKIEDVGESYWTQIEEIKSNLGLYGSTGLSEEYFSYSDKILITSIKWISIVQNIKGSINTEWKNRTFLRESYEWISSLEGIINRYDNDDWEIFEKLLEEENSLVEWKSSLLTSIESKMPDGSFKKINLHKISETIIAMMNSEGGNIVIGFIENTEKILSEYEESIFKKGKYNFFDISTEFEKNKYTIDKLYRELEDLIAQELKMEITSFCDNISINQIYITGLNGQEKFILQINIIKSSKKFFTRGENYSILFRKRMGRRNEYSDPINEIE